MQRPRPCERLYKRLVGRMADPVPALEEIMLHQYARRYILSSLEGTPDVLEQLLRGVKAEDVAWDRRPDPDRFTIREVVAHLADWDDVFLDRMTRTREQVEPILQGYDEGQVAKDRDYAHQDPHANLARFRKEREALIAFLRSLTAAEWERIGRHSEIGSISLESQAALICGHDGYHTRQIAEWLK